MVKLDNSTPYLAAVYDSQVRDTIPYYDAFHQETINLIKASSIEPKNWLDTGCGTGTLAQKALSIFFRTPSSFLLTHPEKC